MPFILITMPTASLSAQIGMKESRQTVAFLIKLDWGGSTLLCEGCDRLLASALEALTEPPLGELCAVPLALVPVQRAGRTTLELLVKRCDMTGEAYHISRPVSDQVPRFDLFPVLEGQVSVLSRRSHLRLIWSIKKKKCTADSVGVSVHLILADTFSVRN